MSHKTLKIDEENFTGADLDWEWPEDERKKAPNAAEVREYMELHNADEVGQGENAWTMEDARYHLLLSDKYHNKHDNT